ncbi:MAG: class I SAM-dependent methyltransferase [Armatimonadetes bacterium]|nr:class I SAM-dependent methyltransferase [Armatimonadota bacterium]
MPVPRYADQPALARLQIRLRSRCLPYDLLDRHAAAEGDLLDYGCGYGLVTAHLANDKRRILGYDIDPDRVAAAERALGSDGVSFTTSLDEVAARTYDQILMLDVLYLIPDELHDALFQQFFTWLRPGGSLLLKETLHTGSLAYRLVVAEELLLRALGRTKGQVVRFHQEGYYRALAEREGFEIETATRRASLTNEWGAWLCRRPG